MPSRASPAVVLLTALAPALWWVSSVVAAQTETPAVKPAAAPAADKTVDLPVFKPGLWEYRRTVAVVGARGAPQTTTVQKCSDPSADIRQKLAVTKQKGCRFSPMTREGSHYRSSWTCLVKGATLAMSDVLTAKSATSYEATNESRYGQRTTRTMVIATRIGECPLEPPVKPPVRR